LSGSITPATNYTARILWPLDLRLRLHPILYY
jgi:hypothetical protein